MKKITLVLLAFTLVAGLTLSSCNRAREVTTEEVAAAALATAEVLERNGNARGAAEARAAAADILAGIMGPDAPTPQANATGGGDGGGFFSGIFGGNAAKAQSDAPKNSLMGWMQSGTYYMRYTVEMDVGGQKLPAKGTIAVQDDKLATTTEMTFIGMNMKTRMIKVDGAMWSIDDENKTMMKIPVDTSQASPETVDYSKIKKVGSGRDTINGRTLPYEEYSVSGEVQVTIKFYMDGDTVYAIETETQGMKSVMIIEEQSKNIPRGSFNLPKYEVVTLPQLPSR